ncbi:MAG: hypothetical protein AAB870_00695 [Patescibacteria group bacterium]
MKFLRLALITLVPMAITAAMFFVLQYPSWYFQAVIASFIMQDVMLFFIFPRQERKWDVISITFPIVFHMLLAWAVLFYVEDVHFLYAVAIAHCLLQYIFLGNVYYFLYKFDRYQKRALPHITSYIGIVNVFYATLLVYALSFYQDIPIWYSVGPLLVFLGLTIMQNMWIHDISLRQRWYYIAVVLIVMTQLVFVTQILPSVYFVNALWLVLCYYTAVHMGIAALQKELTRKELTRNGVIIAIVVVLVLITTRWR